MFTFCFQLLLPEVMTKFMGTQNGMAPKTLAILIERVVPLLNDGYQNKPFEGDWTPNGTF